MIVGVVGSRSFENFDYLEEVLGGLFPSGIDTICSGGARGADTLAKEYAVKHGLDYIEISPDWEKYGKVAGMLRNNHIVETSDHIVAFWDGVSRGTQDTIKKAKGKCTIIHVEV